MEHPIIAIGSDHAGWQLKELLKPMLTQSGYHVIDCGPNSKDSVDYPDYAQLVGQEVSIGHADLGILVCGTGTGMAIAANKIRGIRAANCTNTTQSKLSREHNDANILCLGSRIVGDELAIDIVKSFLQATFLGDRHARRVNKIKSLEEADDRA